jgi:hypothetical protein
LAAEGTAVARRPSVALLSCILALVSALALLGLATTMRVANDHPSDEATRDTVTRFYDAVNVTIATGNRSELTRVLAPGFVDRRFASELVWDGPRLAAYLAVLHSTTPSARLVTEVLAADKDRAMVQVRVEGATSDPLFGLPVWSVVDTFRVTAGQIVERKSEGTVGLFEPLASVALGRDLGDRSVVRLDRVTIPPGGTWSGGGRGEMQVLMAATEGVVLGVDTVSSGLVRLGANGATGEEAEVVGPGGAVELSPDQVAILPPSTQVTIRNVAPTRATVLRLQLADPDVFGPELSRVNPAYPHIEDDGRREHLAGGRVSPLPVGREAVGVGRILLAPGAAVTATVPGPVLVWVTGGTLRVAVDGSTGWVTRGETGASSEAGREVLLAGDWVAMPSGASATLLNAGDRPVSFLAWTVGPDRLPIAGT